MLTKAEFHFEIALMAHLGSHPNIIQLVGYCDAPTYSIVMKFCDGSLHNLIFEQRVLKYGEKIQFALDIATGMGFIHSMDIVHLDLKPGNILIDCADPVANRPVAKITDFGFATAIEDTGNGSQRAVKGLQYSRVIGMTTAYAAPEVHKMKSVIVFHLVIVRCIHESRISERRAVKRTSSLTCLPLPLRCLRS